VAGTNAGVGMSALLSGKWTGSPLVFKIASVLHA
jgi:hypothetical protein